MSFFCAPENVSLLNPGEFRFIIHKAPTLSFFVNSVNLPSISIQDVPSSNPFTDIHYSGDHINWQQLDVTFLVDEDLKGYLEIFGWMRGLGFPHDFDEYRNFVDSNTSSKSHSMFSAISSEISVFTNTGSRNTNIEFVFCNAIPTNLTAPMLASNYSNVPTVTCNATFSYTYFDVRKV